MERQPMGRVPTRRELLMRTCNGIGALALANLLAQDAAVPNATCERRRNSVTALQAFAMYNGEMVNEEAKHFADRLIGEAGPDVREQLELGFQLAYDRPPTAREKEQLLPFLKRSFDAREAIVGLCRILLNSNEFIYMD